MDKNHGTRICLFCGARVNNLESHYVKMHQSADADTTSAPLKRMESRPMSSGKRTILVLVLTGIFLACLWGAFETFMADTHEVCTSGGRSRDAPSGECFDSYEADGPAPFRERSANSIIVILLGSIFGYAAWAYWKHTD